mgnify:CR=1 FL=1|jgi:hypothetical protein
MRHHLAVQLEKEKQEQKDNGPIVLTADQLWKYSGKTEETNPDYYGLVKEEMKQKKIRLRLFRKYGITKK